MIACRQNTLTSIRGILPYRSTHGLSPLFQRLSNAFLTGPGARLLVFLLLVPAGFLICWRQWHPHLFVCMEARQIFPFSGEVEAAGKSVLSAAIGAFGLSEHLSRAVSGVLLAVLGFFEAELLAGFNESLIMMASCFFSEDFQLRSRSRYAILAM